MNSNFIHRLSPESTQIQLYLLIPTVVGISRGSPSFIRQPLGPAGVVFGLAVADAC